MSMHGRLDLVITKEVGTKRPIWMLRVRGNTTRKSTPAVTPIGRGPPPRHPVRQNRGAQMIEETRHQSNFTTTGAALGNTNPVWHADQEKPLSLNPLHKSCRWSPEAADRFNQVRQRPRRRVVVQLQRVLWTRNLPPKAGASFLRRIRRTPSQPNTLVREWTSTARKTRQSSHLPGSRPRPDKTTDGTERKTQLSEWWVEVNRRHPCHSSHLVVRSQDTKSGSTTNPDSPLSHLGPSPKTQRQSQRTCL